VTDLFPPRMTPEQREQARSAIMAHVNEHPRPRRRRRFILTLVGIGVVGALGVSAAAWVVLAPLSVRERQVWCYSAADQNAFHAVGQLTRQSAPDKSGKVAVINCAEQWSNGIVSRTPLSGPRKADGYPVPPLVLCERSDGIFAVFPSGKTGTDATSFCEGLGLEPAPAN
jgi:hypothetical protein